MEVWQRRRNPDEVPAKVAVALSDFCRRAKAKAPAQVVREALALLDEAEDFRVLDLCEAEPEATPLGPFAVIDMLHGAEAKVAAQRESIGYYGLARELAGKAAPPPKPDDEPGKKKKPDLDTPAWKEATQKAKDEREAKREKKKEKTVKERIAPKRRAKDDPKPETKVAPPQEFYVHKRGAQMGRGRFVQLSTTKQKIDALMKPEAKSELVAQIDQIGNRLGLLKVLERGYASRKGPLSLADVEKVLSRHELSDRLAAKEKDSIVAAIAASKGSIGRAAFELGVSARDLERLIEGAQVGREVAEIRERYTKEALSPRNLALRLDMVAREKYLDDLKISDRFKEQLSKDLEPLLEGALPASDLEQLALSAAKMHGLDAVRLRRAMTHAGLDQLFTPRLTA
ncbi:MAG: hypothetical protein QM723_04180 [Myxococcaceae bacterium]